MTDMQPKKMIILDILNILRKHTDEDHRLSQQQIQKLMESEYGMKVDRKQSGAIFPNSLNSVFP